uniref:NADH-ubiquinone oxidoreductase chain 4 n=1 Tax=Vargula hilgendorfii TaxID=6674 RepID=A0A7R7GZ00_VARHI|nr:NADH dehydrogenase subunit 4 [Vargula hilgendorfii]
MLKLMLMCLLMVPLRKYWLEVSGLLGLLGICSMNVGVVNSFSGSGLYLDWLSAGLVLLSIWVILLCVLGSSNFNVSIWFNLCLGGLLSVLIMTFCCQSVLMFYISFEASLIPLFFLMMGWGVQPERLQASVYFLLYTLVGSLPLLFSFIWMYLDRGSAMWEGGVSGVNVYVWLGLLVAFLVKLPLFLVHLWLPKAHVEAPLAGSMVLAGVTLKLGVYGIVRLLSTVMEGHVIWGQVFMVVGALGSIVMGLVCLRQVDLKALIAYSSVSHMGVGVLGVMMSNVWGLMGGYWMLLAHGLASSGMFSLANVGYSRLGSRSIYMNKGLLNLMPSMAMWWFLICICNMASPPSLNLFSEMFMLVGVGSWSVYLLILVLVGGYFSACYSLYVFSFTQHGEYKEGSGVSGGYCSEYLLMALHWVPLNIMFIGMYMLL